MKLFRRHNEPKAHLLSEGGLRRQTPIKPRCNIAPDRRTPGRLTADGLSEVLGDFNVGVLGQGQEPWDVFMITKVAGLDSDEVLFWALPSGDLLVAESGTANISVLADAVEKKLERPYKALAGRQDSDYWAVAARQVHVAEFAFTGADSLELERDDATTTFWVAGAVSSLPAPRELEAIGKAGGRDFYVAAERLHGDTWDVRIG